MRTITNLTVINDFIIELTYDNSEKIKIDFKNKINKGGIYKPLNDKDYFLTVQISSNGRFIHWNDDIEICADALWYEGSEEHFPEDLQEVS